MKDLRRSFILKWSIAAYASPYRCSTRRRDLCLTEKYIIARADQERLDKVLAKLSTWCFEHSADISCSLLVNPSHTDESWDGRNTCM